MQHGYKVKNRLKTPTYISMLCPGNIYRLPNLRIPVRLTIQMTCKILHIRVLRYQESDAT